MAELTWENITKTRHGADWLEIGEPGLIKEMIRVDGPGEYGDTCTVYMNHSDEIAYPEGGVTYLPGPTPNAVQLQFYHPISNFMLLGLIGRKRG
jgi:hypothetical protein